MGVVTLRQNYGKKASKPGEGPGLTIFASKKPLP